MNWVKFLAKAVMIYLILWIVCVYVPGEFYLSDIVVPVKDVEISEWMDSYFLAGGVVAIVTFIFSMIWFFIGDRYTGEEGIRAKHNLLWLLATIASIVIPFILVEDFQDGGHISYVFIFLIAPIGFYINSLFNSAAEVKYIPPFAQKIHG